MNDIVSGNNNPDIIVGDGTSQESLSYQVAQAIYAEKTGKSERISEDYSKSFILTKEDIKQLHYRVTQSKEQYNIASSNVSFSIEYLKSSSERYSSIERFITHAGSRGSVVEEISIQCVRRRAFLFPETK